MSASKAVMAAKKVIDAAWLHGEAYDLASQAAFALESAQMLQSPETSAELVRLRAERAEVGNEVARFGIYGAALPATKALVRRADELVTENAQLRARVAELEAQRDRRRVRLVALQNDALNMRGTLSPNGEDNKVPFTLGETLTPAVEWLVNRVAELELERHSTNEALDDAVQALRAKQDEPAKGPTPDESASRWTAFFAPVASLREDPHDSPLHHAYRVGHDLPETGGAQ
ncbi:hypothetical protein ACFXKI_10095 [Streptomyces mirabilis]|uniref:hypothetical protein n=1 Tax=Streptomyces mirabilis TaxID=68239 RepID=UPI00369C5D3A